MLLTPKSFLTVQCSHEDVRLRRSCQFAQEWNERQKRLQEAKWGDKGSDEEGGEDEDDGLPFACYICRRPWEEVADPVVTRCKHYFCEACALQHNAKSAKCFVCEAPTQGIFNIAHEIRRKVKQKQKNVAG